MTTPADLLPRDAIDRLLRDSLREPDHLRWFLRQAVPHLADGFDYTRAKLLERTFSMPDWREREADLPFEIPYRVGDQEIWALVCVLLEHQSDTDPLIPLRLLTFATQYWDRQWRAWQALTPPRPSLELSPVLPIVFYTGDVPWGSNRRLTDLLGEPKAFHGFAPQWEPLFWNLTDHDAETLLKTGEDWLQLLGVLRSSRDDLPHMDAVLREAVLHLQGLAESNRTQFDKLMYKLLTVVMFRRPQSEHETLVKAAAESQITPARQGEVQTMTQTIAEYYAEQGAVRSRRGYLRMVLEKKFGSLPDALVAQINVVKDLDELDRLFQQALDVEKLDDVRF